MGISINWICWSSPLAFTIHNIEEVLFLPDWSKSADKFHKPVGAFEFRFAPVIVNALSVALTMLSSMNGKQSVAGYLFF